MQTQNTSNQNIKNQTIANQILLFIAALFAGGILNMMIVELSPFIIPAPAGADFTSEEGLIRSMKLMEPKHFIMPFLAHALGTLLTGAVLTGFIKNSSRLKTYLILSGALFFAGGASMVISLPSPLWFNILDLVFAYFPMVFIPYWFKYKKLW